MTYSGFVNFIFNFTLKTYWFLFALSVLFYIIGIPLLLSVTEKLHEKNPCNNILKQDEQEKCKKNYSVWGSVFTFLGSIILIFILFRFFLFIHKIITGN